MDKIGNVLAVYGLRTDQDSWALDWYRQAHALCLQWRGAYGVSVRQAAGVLSALSPATSWSRNKVDAENVIRYHVYGGPLPKVATYGPNLRKALQVLQTPDDQIIDLFPEKTGAKTRSFYLCIIGPECPTEVCIDRHAAKIADGDILSGGVSLTPKQYREYQAVYRLAAKKVGLLPSELQAITWTIRRRYKGYED